MKRFFSLSVCLMLFSLTSTAQSIEIQKSIWGLRFSQNGDLLNINQLVDAVETHPEAFILAKKAKSKNTVATIIGGIGGACIGIPAGAAVGGGEAPWALAGVGAGLILVSIPFSMKANKQFESSVNAYNQSLGGLENRVFQPQLSLLADADGFGLSIRF
ncbi:MAG: hypothetical protein AAFQ68_07240 [Bacteroidota bacterium]